MLLKTYHFQLSGDARVVVEPSDNSNVINNPDSLKIKISLNNRKRRLSSDASPSPPSYSSSLSPGARPEGGGKRARGVARTRGRARGVGRGEGRGKARGLHDWENSRTWLCGICGLYDPVTAAGATTEWIGCDCNR